MGFQKKILFLALISNMILFTYQQTSPEERCATNGDGSRVCITCSEFGTCSDNGDGTFSVITPVSCPPTPPNVFCDDSLYTDGSGYGQCSPLPVTYTDCGCTSTEACLADPNDPELLLQCGITTPSSGCVTGSSTFDSSTFESTTPEVSTFESTTPEVSTFESTTPEVSTFESTTPEVSTFESTTPEVSTFESTTPEVSTPGPTTTEPISPTTALVCPADCPFIEDPNATECGEYFYCTEQGLFSQVCPTPLCFDETECSCIEIVTTTVSVSTAAPTTTPGVTCTDACPFAKDPSDDCTSYFYCYNDQLLPYVCPPGLCFVDAECSCIETVITTTEPPVESTTEPLVESTTEPLIESSTEPPIESTTEPLIESTTEVLLSTTTTTTTTTLTCTGDCPYVDDPNDNCQNFFICDGDTLIAHTCTGTLCYNSATCQCDI